MGFNVLDHLDDFCYPVSLFWRRDDSWMLYPGNPGNESGGYAWHDSVDLTLCFEDTAILFGICAIFWILTAIGFLIGSSNKPSIPRGWLNIAKITLCCVIMIPTLCDLIYTIIKSTKETEAKFYFFSPIVLFLTMIVAAVLIVFERRRGVRSSGLLSVFWMSLVAYASIKTRSLVLIARDEGEVAGHFRFSTFMIEFVLFIVQMILSLIPEPKSPYDYFREDDREPCPEEAAPFFSRITWWWLNKLVWKGYRKALTYNELYDLNYGEKSRVVSPRFQQAWDQQMGKDRANNTEPGVTVRRRSPSLVVALTKSYGLLLFLAGFLKLANDLLAFVSPQILKLLIEYVKDPDEPAWKGYFYTLIMFGAAVLQSIILHQYFHSCFVAGMRIRSGVIAAVYRKALTLSNKSRQNRTVGEVVNLMSVDAQRFMDFVTYMHYLWSSPLQIVLSLIFLYATMGPSIFAGFGVMILLVPLNMVMAALSRRFQVQLMTWKDSRIKIVNEVLNGIKVIKLYAWEIPFKQMIMGLRKEEVNVLKKSAYANASFSFTWTCAPFMVALATFATYSLVHRNSTNPDDRLTAEKAFVALSLFNILRFPLSMLPMVISSAVEASVSVKRMSSYLKGEELDPNNTNRREEPAVGDEESVSVSGGSFTWDTPERPALHNIDLSVKPGELVAVVGPVGAGKSSLISALLGEMDKLNGQVVMRGSVAYVPQQAWIQNATVKDNILFGKPLNPILYGQTVQSCALETDLEILPGGDMTEIGEKGINLSGGQKQRVSLARAVYQESDVYLLDDPLSAVDSHVGKHIFDKVIGPEGVLKGKVRILVTHGIGFLSQCDKIIVMSNGRITEVGSYNELIDQDGTFAELLHNYGTNEGNEEDEGNPYANEYAEYEGDGVEEAIFSDNNNNEETAARPYLVRQRSRYKSSDGIDDGEGIPAPVRPRPKLNRGLSKTDLKRQLSKQASIINDEKIIKAEANERTQLIGAEKVETGTVKFSVFIDYAKACTYYMSFIIVLFTVLSNGASVGQNLWLAHWSNGEENSNSSNLTLDLGVYASLGVLQGLMVLFSSFALAIGSLKASVKLHDGMLSNILRSPMSFFDTTPLGRILNRFSKDIYTIDEAIPRSYKMFLMTLLSVVSTIIVISIASPWFLIIIVPLMVLYVLIQRFYVATSRQLKRLESSSRSPIYSHFQESISGATSIRAYSKVDQFQLQSEARVDYNQIAYYPSICANRWLAIRLEFLGNLIILFASLFAVLQRNYSGVFGSISPGIAGLSISYALQVTQALNWMVRMTSELETNIVAVERTKEYSETPTEAADIIPDHRVPTDWPVEGRVQFDHYSTRYRPGLDLVLKDISCNIPGGQKVGIVGRTGAGKSSLTVALFRIIESAQGAILIDGVDISTYGLSDLRSHITIIPQDPVLFSGTLRINLDPFNSHTDDDIWRALETAHLSEFVEGLAEGLEYPVAEGGENLSVGQRQLVCLARALLRKTKILVLDEATAAVDLETDDLIQKTIRKEFAGCTVLTIAHRLNTIMDYDKIMVLDAGRISEFDSPNVLLERRGLFYGMAKDAGLA